MPQVSAKGIPVDPYKNFRFRVRYSDRSDYIAAVSKISGLKRSTEVVKHRAGGDPTTSRKLPGRTEYEAVTLERGVTFDTEFANWANSVWSFRRVGGGVATSLATFRRDLVIDVLDDGGSVVSSYSLHRAWVSEYQALSDLDANANAVLIEHIKLENEGWVHEGPKGPPAETSFQDPA
ncbi:phage tail protein [Allokutzneria multivorans]|uniref:Phage tail protein n=1 Tax=Allokutzneria multivorans TaxID=1142134 RepID=A0ABP7S2B7_9PSEU